ncbi:MULTISPECIES: ligand-binding sensor domain-containing diguanylate cyclase [Stenotrophomonas]|uniref:ligand-binding sensor domain-containing diguanylate cyclase n=1 Tax=Stenotrophomonas TaxID=40323 RepID=UPI001F48DF15|nr:MULTISPECIES: ligand-binding sensor domain-containing diguanylate cyclase [Stenotrophomonas]
MARSIEIAWGRGFRGAARPVPCWCMALVLACLILLPAARAADGRHYMVSDWTMADGLPHNLVHALAQDRDGFIWAGTWEGVVRFNGRHFTVFDRQNTPGAELSGVFCILAEADGGVLFGTAADGVFRYHHGRWQHLGEPAARRLPVSALLRDTDGGLWIASANRLLRMDVHGRVHDVGADAGLPGVRINALARSGDGALLVAADTGAYRLQGGRALPWAADWAGTNAVRGIAGDGADGWLLATDDGVYWRDAGGKVEHLQAGRRVEAVLRDAVGAIWMSLSSGDLLRHAGDGDERLTITGPVSPALLADREGLIWSGSTDGLHRVAEVAAVGFTRKDGLGSDYVRVVLQSEDRTLWIGHADGLDRWHQQRMHPVRLGDGGGRDPSVLALAWRDDMLWAGTYDKGVFRLDAQGRVQERIRLGSHGEPIVRALLADPDGGLWIGGTHGLSHYRNGQLQLRLDSRGQPTAVVHALYRDGDGTLWIGTTGGMAALRPDGTLRTWNAEDDIPAQYVFDFLRDPGGDLWIASDRGLLRMREGGFRVYDHRHGLPRDKLFRIIDDQAGNLWLPSNIGVFRIARKELDQIDAGTRRQLAVHVIDHSDGMPGSQGNGASMPAGWRASNGALAFPTSAGLGLIDPRIAGRYDGKAPPVVFESVSVDGVQQTLADRLRLEPGARRLAVDYTALSFRAPDKIRYRYRLHGFDGDWVEAGAGTEAVYTNLTPGHHRLEVQAMALPLDWSRQAEVGTAVMELDVVPPLWKRTSSRVLAGLALAAAVVLGFWLRTASYRRSQRRLGRVIAARTEELSDKNRALELAGIERDRLLQQLEHQATHDVLTGLPNRRAAELHLRQALERAGDRGEPLCVALIDIDHFKQINDRHGHHSGDRVLREVAELLRLQLDGDQFVSRHGGEEFLAVLRGVTLEQALERLQALRLALARQRMDEIAPGLVVTASIGVAECGPGQESPRTLLAAADRQLYRAKREGRNRVCGL